MNMTKHDIKLVTAAKRGTTGSNFVQTYCKLSHLILYVSMFGITHKNIHRLLLIAKGFLVKKS